MERIKIKNKRVLLVGINFSPELTGIGKYSGEMVEWLTENNYDCTVVTSFPYYPNWKVQEPYTAKFYKKETLKAGKLQVYRCPLYVPAKPSGVKRILHDASFFLSAFFMVFFLLFKKSNDYIFCMAPPFHLGFLGLFYRFFKGGQMIYHIQDLQIEAAIDLKIIKSESAFAFLFRLERFILRHANYVSTISTGMINKIAAKIQKNILLFPNWVDTEMFHPQAGKAELKERWGFRASDKIVLYSGSVGEKQGLESLISIAKNLERKPAIKFVICGDGPYKQNLVKMAHEADLRNILFLPLQPLETFNDFLNMTDVHLVLQKKNACDLMMPSKLSTIWSSGGLALVTAEPGSTLHTLIKENNMGVVIDCEQEDLLRDAILKCCTADHYAEHVNGRAYAETFLNKQSILTKLMRSLENTAYEEVSLKEEFVQTVNIL